MIKCTTPTIKIYADLDFTEIEKCEIDLAQEDVLVVKDGIVENDYVYCTLNQEDTKDFKEGNVDIQLKCKFKDGKSVFASNIVKQPLNRILNDEVM